MTQWVDIEVAVYDKNVTISLNGQEVYTQPYEDTLGNITGLALVSNGLCEVDYLELTGWDGSSVYKSDFEAPGTTINSFP